MFRLAKMRKMFAVMAVTLMAFVLVLAVAEAAWAAAGGMPWEDGLELLKKSLSGPVAQAIGLIAIVAAGAALIFGGDMTGFMRTCVYIVLVLGLILGATNLMTAFTPK